MKKIIALFLIAFVLFLTACDTGSGAAGSTSGESSAVTDPIESSGNVEPDETTSGEAASAEESSSKDSAHSDEPTDRRFIPKHCTANNQGMLLHAYFPKSAHVSSTPFEGTLMLTNETEQEQAFYLHLAFTVGQYDFMINDGTDLSPVFSEIRETYTSEAPQMITLAPGESITFDFSVDTDYETFNYDCNMFFGIFLYATENYERESLMYSYEIPIDTQGLLYY